MERETGIEFIDSSRDKIRQSLYYVLIGVISLVALIFFPMLGSTIGLAWQLPTTVPGWIVWVGTKVLVAIVNILIYHCFIQQGKLNVKDNKNYIEANRILQTFKDKTYVPRSPSKFLTQQYGSKSVGLFVATALSLVAFSQAILTFDYIAMLTYLMTLVMGVVFGVIEMKSVEVYWTEEFYDYAKKVEQEHAIEAARAKEEQDRRDLEMAQKELNKQTDDMVHTDRRSNLLDTSVGSSVDSTNNTEQLVVDSNTISDSLLGRSIHTCDTNSDSIDNESENITSKI